MKFPVAIQLYSLREETAKNFSETLQAVAEMGYDGVEFAGLGGHTVAEMQAMLKENGLRAISAHVALEELVVDPDKTLADYKALGCDYVAIPYLVEEKRPGGVDFDNALRAIAVIGAKAKEMGMQLLYHNHDFEFQTVDGEYLLDMLYRVTDPAHLAVQPDVCWVSVGGEDPAEYIKKYDGRVPVVHLKNYVGGKTDHMYELIGIESDKPKDEKPFEMRSLGEGIVDIPAVLAAAQEVGSKWVVVEQDLPTPGKTPMVCAKESIDYLRSL
ncbi:MAG: sugar phosphate isomerase/epimerase [Clostridia bacterium]|nr:sugar phosphate isomerase/epimerase [Clostridia bacterium]